MKHNRIFILLIFFLLVGCNNYKSYYNVEADNTLNYQKNHFGKEYEIKELLNHFPEKIKNDSVSFFSHPPTCPPTYKCMSQFGDIVFIMNKFDYKQELSELLDNEIIFNTVYSDNNIIINLLELKDSIFYTEKCNKWYENKLPIPYFERYNFGMGKEVFNKKKNNEEYFDYIYNIPSDLSVFVLNAKAGDYWIKSCNENRPKSLKDWGHGYSKGFAISEKLELLIYWTMIW